MDTGGDVLAGSTPHYRSDVLRGKLLLPKEDFIALPIINKEVYH